MGSLLSLLRPWQPERGKVLQHLTPPAFHAFRLDRFPRGIDNVHIDVWLDIEFCAAAATLVRSVLREDVQRHFWKQPLKAPNVEAVDVFRKAYTELSREVFKRARSSARPERVQLFQLAVLKLLLGLVDKEMGLLRDELDDARAHPARQHSGQSLRLHEQTVLLARHARSIRFRTAAEVVRIVMRMENSSLRKMRKTILGSSWPVSADMLNNPLLQLAGLGDADDFIGFYPFLLRRDEAAQRLCAIVMQVLGSWLPDKVGGAANAVAHVAEPKLRRDQGGMNGYVEVERRLDAIVSEEELSLAAPHAFDNADAVSELLGGSEVDWPQPGEWKDRRMPKWQRRLVRKLGERVQQAGLAADVRASYLLQAIYPGLGVRDCAESVFDYLAGRVRRRDLVRRLGSQPDIADAGALLRRIDERVREHNAGQTNLWQRQLVRCAVDCLRFRYQLKLAWWMYQGMDSLRLVLNAREREMSQANGLLQAFSRDALDNEADRPVVGHVVIKADVRGSTEITARMRARDLNPAAYFSRNLYDPINALLKAYGAEKVFVEGDAVILAIIEYGEARQQHLAVARACGLAQRILEVVDAKNAESRRLDLPQLELGLGIAYSDEAPTYLYDEGHKIMISPAINRADRLSSCNARLRVQLEEKEGARRGIDVVSTIAAGGRRQELLRYNVNGIELEAPAFYQLGVELKMRQVHLNEMLGEHKSVFHVGRYPDLNGNTHWLVVREAPVRLWIGSEVVDEASEGRRFHEVVTDKEIRAAVQKRMSRKPARNAS